MREQRHSGEKQETDAHALFAFLHWGMGCRTLQMLLLCSPARRTDVGWSHRQVFSNSNMDATLELYGKPAVAQLSLGEAGCVKRPWTRRRRHLASPDAREPRPSTPRAIRAQGPQTFLHRHQGPWGRMTHQKRTRWGTIFGGGALYH